MAGERFVIISGLPGSGKTTLARRLAPRLHLPIIDKDDILEQLYESRGIGDARWRRILSRESDVMLQHQAASSSGAVLVSFWRWPGMPMDSGTPTDWLAALSGPVVEVRCVCEPEVAADRFLRRKRHPGHLDDETSYEHVLASLRALSGLESSGIEPLVLVDTTVELNLDATVDRVRERLAAATACHVVDGRSQGGET